MKQKGMNTAYALHKASGVTETAISNILRGDVRFPHDGTLNKLSEALGTTRSELTALAIAEKAK